ncbi:zinc ribbon domain-containing protein [Alteriqipengyuania lutimaris]|uniref:Zinc ribbon domain-containing protein n=1 Tax=Alteriqipengyuania lutimaris TaxID=1538146 RepID=A0A395LLC6_9SPHN|nr:zinc ribbon domain-containing protein [Alteriqipengyuania lutimaris]MBB3034942.1 hypothetical protein [Alteriqipengyuania lutimaris]RDS76234.1 zinc ribbon domain-containing protein [Alteriqipengyuania lutimaris]
MTSRKNKLNNDLPLDANFVEQAEYIPQAQFRDLSAIHPDEDSIVRRLMVGGAKLLVGPRGCGKTTLLLKAYYKLLDNDARNSLPVYVNFKLSLKMEPLYLETSNASYWFKSWLNLKILEGLYRTIDEIEDLELPSDLPSKKTVRRSIDNLESAQTDRIIDPERFSTEAVVTYLTEVVELNGLTRSVLLLDDAAHAFSAKQQEDFFEFFRQVKSREISPKAAVYPGVTTFSPAFHAGHDAEIIDVWFRPDSKDYVEYMSAMAEKRFNGALPQTLIEVSDALQFLAYTSFGIPRSFLNMLRTIYHEESKHTVKGVLERRKILEIAKESRELSHNVYESLTHKLPAYRDYVSAGQKIYQGLLYRIKDYNRDRPSSEQALEVGLRRPLTPDLEKIISFYQYAGLLMPAGENSRGVKGVFDLYLVHFGDLVTENAIIGKRSKSIASFVQAFEGQGHQAWPRISADTLLSDFLGGESFGLALPNCQVCGAERISESAKFCQNCGSRLKNSSIYETLTRQDISVLPLSDRMVTRIKENSNIRTVQDILIDTDRTSLRSIHMIGEIRAAMISNYAEEYVA